MRLTYEIAATGDAQLKRIMRSIEAEAVANARRGAVRDQRAGRQKVVTAERTTKQAIRAQAALEARQMREVEKTNRYWEMQKRTHHAWQLRAIDKERRAREAATKRASALEVREARRAQAVRERTVGRVMAGAGRTVRGTAGMLAGGVRTLGGVAALGGSLAVGNAVRTQMDEQAMASSLANQAGTPELKGQLLKEAQAVKGFTGAEALAALEGFVGLTGDLDTARAMLQDLGKFALATGTSFEDAATAAGNFANNLDGIEDPSKRASAVMEAMRALGGQGAAGAVEIKDLAGGGATLGAVAAQMAGDALENIKKAGVLAQAARAKGGAASPAEALTAVARFTDMVAQNADKLEKMGVSVGKRDSKGNLTEVGDVRKLIADILDKTGGDLGQMNELLGIYGQKVTRGFSQAHKERGRAGVYEQFDRLMQTELSTGDLTVRADSRLDDADLRFKEGIKELNATLGEKLLPEAVKVADALGAAAPALGDLAVTAIEVAKLFGEHPWAGLGVIVAGHIGKEIAMAKLGEVVANGLKTAMGGSVPLPGQPTPTAPAPGKGFNPWNAAKGAPLATLGTAAAGAALLYGAYELSKPAQATMREHSSGLSTGHFSASPYAAPGMIPAEVYQREAKGSDGPQFQRVQLDTTQFDRSSKDMAESIKAAMREAAAEIARSTALNRTNPMSKRGP